MSQNQIPINRIIRVTNSAIGKKFNGNGVPSFSYVQTVTAGDDTIIVAGTQSNPTVLVNQDVIASKLWVIQQDYLTSAITQIMIGNVPVVGNINFAGDAVSFNSQTKTFTFTGIQTINGLSTSSMLMKSGNTVNLQITDDGLGNLVFTVIGGGGGGFDPTASYVFSGNNQFTKLIQGTTTGTQYDFVVTSQNTNLTTIPLNFVAGEEYVLFPSANDGYVEFQLLLKGEYITGVSTKYGEITAKFSIEFMDSVGYSTASIKLLSMNQSSDGALTQSQLNQLFTFKAYNIPTPIPINGVNTAGVIYTVTLNTTLPWGLPVVTTNTLSAHVSSNSSAAYRHMNNAAMLGVVNGAYSAQTMSVVKYDTSLLQSSLDNLTIGINPTTGQNQSLTTFTSSFTNPTTIWTAGTCFLLDQVPATSGVYHDLSIYLTDGFSACEIGLSILGTSCVVAMFSGQLGNRLGTYSNFLKYFSINYDSANRGLLYLTITQDYTATAIFEVSVNRNTAEGITPSYIPQLCHVVTPTPTTLVPLTLTSSSAVNVDNFTLGVNPTSGLTQSLGLYATTFAAPIDLVANPIVATNYLVIPITPGFAIELWNRYAGDVELHLYGAIAASQWDITISLAALCCNDRSGVAGTGLINSYASYNFPGTIGKLFVGDTQSTAGLPAPFASNRAGQTFLAIEIPTINTPGTGAFNITGLSLAASNPVITGYLVANPVTTIVQFTAAQIAASYPYVNLVNINTLGSIQSINKDATPAQQIVGDGSNIDAKTTDGTTIVKYIGTGGSSDPVIDLVPVTLVNGETVIAFFPLNQASGAKNLQWQTYGKVQGTVYSPNGTLAETSVIDFDVAAAYYSAENISVELNYNGGTYISNTEPSILSSLNNLQPKAYQMTIGTVTYCLITYQQSTVNSYLLQTQFSANLANDGGILAAKYVGQLLSTITAPTPVLLSNFTYNVTPKTTKIQDIVAEQYTTNSFPVARGWVDGNNNPILQLPAQGGFNAGGAGIKTLNVYIVDFVSSNKSITYSTTANPAITTVAISGLIDGDVISDMTYIGTGDTNGSYYACSPSGNVYSSPANAAILFRVWSFVGNAGFALYSICNNGTSLVATGAGNNFYSNVTGNWQTKQFGSANVRTINCSSYMPNATGNIQGVGNVTGIWVFAGVTTTGGFTCLYYQPSMIYGGVVPIGAWGQSSCHSMVWTNNTNGILFACSSGNILTGGTTSFPLSYSSSVTSVSPSGVTSLDNFISITSDGTRAFVVDSYSGAIYWHLILATITGLWTKITLSNFVPTQVTSATTGANPTFIYGALNSKAAIAVNASSALTPNFATELVPLYENRATIFAPSSSDQRVATLGDIAALIQFMTGNTTKSLVDTLEEFRTYQLGHAEPLSTKIESMLKVNHKVIDVEYTVSKD